MTHLHSFSGVSGTVTKQTAAFDTYVVSSEIAVSRVAWLGFAGLGLDDTFLVAEVEDGYRLLKPIPISICKNGPRDFTARFRAANIAASGESALEAREALVAEILDTYDTLATEPSLSDEAARQLNVLCAYLERS